MNSWISNLIRIILTATVAVQSSCSDYRGNLYNPLNGRYFEAQRPYAGYNISPPRQAATRTDYGSTPRKTESDLSTVAIIGLACIALPFLLEEELLIGGAEILEEGAAASRLAAEAAAAETEAEALAARAAGQMDNQVFSIGRYEDTGGFSNWGRRRLDIPNWTIEKNDAFITDIINRRAKVFVASPEEEAITHATFARELRQLRAAGYRRSGNFLVPPQN